MPTHALFSKRIVISWVICVLAFVMGCGYHLGGLRNTPPAEIRTIAIPLFTNHTQEPRIENYFTEAFRDQFYRLSSFCVASQKENADVFLQGEILATSAYPASFDRKGLAVEYLARVTVSVQIRRTGDGMLVWGIDRLEDTQYFKASSDALQFSDNRSEAFLTIARRVSERTIDQMIVGF